MHTARKDKDDDRISVALHVRSTPHPALDPPSANAALPLTAELERTLELQSLNKELTALNNQLQETLEKQRFTSTELQNVLYSTDVATIFLDTELKIRFFTPSTKALFPIIPGDVGRPLADLRSLAADSGLMEDAAAVLQTHAAIEREIETNNSTCYIRRILPYRTEAIEIEGVVITFTDVTDRSHNLHALEAAKQAAELANNAKSRFLASASHDLRQSLQTLSLLQGFLSESIQGEKAMNQVRQLGDAVNAMAGMLSSLQPLDLNQMLPACRRFESNQKQPQPRAHGAVLIVDDDPDLRMLLETLIKENGYVAASAQDGESAIALIDSAVIHPDLILTDFNLPNGLNGLELVKQARSKLHHDIPTIILTGGITNATSHDIVNSNCLPILKPVRVGELLDAIRHLLLAATAPEEPRPILATVPALLNQEEPVIFLVDDDCCLRQGIRAFLEEHGHQVEDFASCEEFLSAYRPRRDACLLVDAYLPGMKGLELLMRLKEMESKLPTIMITGRSDVQMAVQAMKSGASDFIEKPFDGGELVASIKRAIEQSRDGIKLMALYDDAAARMATLTPRQRQVMEMVLAGEPSKNIAADLHLSQRTIEHHRAAVMEKTGSKSLPALARLALAAAQLRPAV